MSLTALAEDYTFEPLEDLDEQDLFLSILYHSQNGGNAIRMLLGEEDGKPYIRHFANKDIKKIQYRNTKYNAYTTINTFRGFKRVTDEVFNYSGIFIDLDYHDYKTIDELDRAIDKTKTRLKKAYKEGLISPATMITHTGRGLGVFYILNCSISNTPKAHNSIRYLNEVRAALTAKYAKLFEDDSYLTVDTTVKDAARVCRIPLTYNHNAKRFCRLIHVTYDDEANVKYYDLSELAKENHLFDRINEIKREIASKKIVSLDAYRLPFLTLRLHKLELLQELRNYDCTGTREYTIFVYYNAAKQIYGVSGGIAATRDFNSKFTNPLSDSELEHAFTVTDKNIPPTHDYEGFYKLPDSWVMENLAVTEEENRICRFGSSKKQIERQLTKEKNKSKREERNKEIAEYIMANPDIKYPDIAKLFSVSESTIYRICKAYNITRYQTETNKTVENAESTVAHENLHFLPQKSGMLSGSPEDRPFSVYYNVSSLPVSVDNDALVEGYLSLYDEVTEKRRRRRQIPGQLCFRLDDNGQINYYMIS